MQGIGKIISQNNGHVRRAYVSKRNEWGEYRVKLYIDGKYQQNADYFTDDKGDAVQTARAMVERWT
jgi:hypothetical protein